MYQAPKESNFEPEDILHEYTVFMYCFARSEHNPFREHYHVQYVKELNVEYEVFCGLKSLSTTNLQYVVRPVLNGVVNPHHDTRCDVSIFCL